MQVLDEQKRLKIIAVAAELFATQPFHKVRLSEVAETAGVGKGTLYVYFKSKDDLYMSVLYSSFAQLIERMQRRLDQDQLSPLENLEAAIGEIVHFAYQNPHMYELMRTITWRDDAENAHWCSKRREFKALLESIIRRGISAGDFTDPHPELTARFIPGLARSVLMEGLGSTDPQTLSEHMLWFVGKALNSGKKSSARAASHSDKRT
jgi:AcrR family transcriptional regulator